MSVFASSEFANFELFGCHLQKPTQHFSLTGSLQVVVNVFLPSGYPETVTPDYLEYQIYDSLQAFSSSIAGLLASRAVLEGVGVGDANASPTSALLLSILQDSFGRIATILFAWRMGAALEPECKRYRLAADFFNDGAMIMDCLSPVFPSVIRVPLLCFSSILRALCGVAAGGAKAALGRHFVAERGSLGDLSAKESSQETVVSLLGMLAGSVFVSRVVSTSATWTSLLLLIVVHLYTNYRAVRAVSMNTLNRQRTNLIFSTLDDNQVPTPSVISKMERIFSRGSRLVWKGRAIGNCEIGVPFESLLELSSKDVPLATLLDTFRNEAYLLWCDRPRGVRITIKQQATPRDIIRAWVHALYLAQMASGEPQENASVLVKKSLQKLESFGYDCERLQAAGWDLDESSSLVTRSISRVEISDEVKNKEE